MKPHSDSQPTPPPYLPVEAVMDEVVRLAGGIKVSQLVGENPEFKNADYFFENESVIAELKEIRGDPLADEAIIERATQVYREAVKNGDAPDFIGTIPVRIDKLPDKYAIGMLAPFRERLERRVKEAAKQIKQTKAAFGLENALGLLILVNDASTFYRPDVTFNLLHHILNGSQHRSIDHVIYCSVNMLLSHPSFSARGRFWASAAVDGRLGVPEPVSEKLFAYWRKVIDAKLGGKGPLHWLDGADAQIHKARFHGLD